MLLCYLILILQNLWRRRLKSQFYYLVFDVNAAELEAVPDLIMLFHKERKALLSKSAMEERPSVEELANVGIHGTIESRIYSIPCHECDDKDLIEI